MNPGKTQGNWEKSGLSTRYWASSTVHVYILTQMGLMELRNKADKVRGAMQRALWSMGSLYRHNVGLSQNQHSAIRYTHNKELDGLSRRITERQHSLIFRTSLFTHGGGQQQLCPMIWSKTFHGHTGPNHCGVTPVAPDVGVEGWKHPNRTAGYGMGSPWSR